MILSELTLKALFIAAPLQVLPLLDETARLDLVDLYEAGITARVGNKLGGQSELVQLSDSLISLKLTNISTMDITWAADSVLTVRHEVCCGDIKKNTENNYTPAWKLIKVSSAKNR